MAIVRQKRRGTVLPGHRQGKLTVVQVVGTKDDRKVHCLCDCGVPVVATRISWMEGHITCCRGCRLDEKGAIPGTRYGVLKVTCALSMTSVMVKCDCGQEREMRIADLSKRSRCGTSCGLRRQLDMVGQVFGRMTVLGLAPKASYMLCRCACGTVKAAHRDNLRYGRTRSCGAPTCREITRQAA